MPRTQTLTPIFHTTDSEFRTWGQEFTNLVDFGNHFVNSGDTGQINWATATRPVTNGYAGFIVRRFNDVHQATAPYFARFDFGTQSSVLAIALTVGTGTNGSGTITGTLLSQTIISRSMAGVTSALPSYVYAAPGTITVAYKVGYNSGGLAFFSMSRVRNLLGSTTADGLHVSINPSTGQSGIANTYRRVVPATFGPSQSLCFVPLGVNTSISLGQTPLRYSHWCALPEPRPILETLSVMSAEVAANSLLPVNAFGQNLEYVCLGRLPVGAFVAGSSTSDSFYHLCMLYTND